MKTNALTNFIDFFKKPFFTYGIFWSWNFIFIILLIFSEFQGQFLFSIIKNALVGYTPMDFSIYSLIIFLSPIGSIVLGLTILRKKPLHLMRLFYGVEIPLILLFVLRLSVFKELTSSTTHLFILLFFGILSFLTELLISKDKTPRWLIISQKIGHSLLLIIGVYIGMVLIFYSLPLLWLMISNIFTFGWLEILQAGFFIFLFAIFFIYTATLIVFLPIAIVWLYISAFIRNYKINIPKGKAITFTTLGINIALLFILNISQPQSLSFDKLELDFSKSENIQEFNNNSEKIKKGLLNAYLSKYRYISSVKSNNHIEAMYRESFGADGFAEGAQSVYNFIMSPFLYNGSMRIDALKAEEYYEKYFDGNIQKHEKEAIIKAMKSTWDSDGIEAGLLNVNQEKVHIEEQEITINEFNDIAEIEIYEVYKNMTFSRQEIFYYFSLPPNSVITGLWLSDDANNRKKFSFNVSPRGAAQKVYKEEVRRRVDPSLLEQVGPNQYRLRAFPIEPKRKDYMNGRRNGYTIKEGAEFHLSLSYKTLISADNKWLLPRLSEKRNVYWSEDTRLIVNNNVMDKEDNWLPESINASSKGNINTHIAKVLDSLFIKMETTKTETPFNLENKKLSLLIDGSYSMLKEKDNLLHII